MPVHRKLCEPMNCVHFHISDPVPSELLTKEELNVFMTLFHKIQYALEKEEREENSEIFKKPIHHPVYRSGKRKYRRSSIRDDSSCEDELNYVKPKKKIFDREYRNNKDSGKLFHHSARIYFNLLALTFRRRQRVVRYSEFL